MKELSRLAKIEEKIRRRNSDTLPLFLEIYRDKLYLPDYPSFPVYAKSIWGYQKAYSHRLIAFAKFIEKSPMGDLLDGITERACRPLTRLKNNEDIQKARIEIQALKAVGTPLTESLTLDLVNKILPKKESPSEEAVEKRRLEKLSKNARTLISDLKSLQSLDTPTTIVLTSLAKVLEETMNEDSYEEEPVEQLLLFGNPAPLTYIPPLEKDFKISSLANIFVKQGAKVNARAYSLPGPLADICIRYTVTPGQSVWLTECPTPPWCSRRDDNSKIIFERLVSASKASDVEDFVKLGVSSLQARVGSEKMLKGFGTAAAQEDYGSWHHTYLREAS